MVTSASSDLGWKGTNPKPNSSGHSDHNPRGHHQAHGLISWLGGSAIASLQLFPQSYSQYRHVQIIWVLIWETDIGDKKWLTAVSKIQCKIIKTDKGLFVKDRSSNSTWATKLGRKACHLRSMMLYFLCKSKEESVCIYEQHVGGGELPWGPQFLRPCGTISKMVSSSDTILNKVKILQSVFKLNVINLLDDADNHT